MVAGDRSARAAAGLARICCVALGAVLLGTPATAQIISEAPAAEGSRMSNFFRDATQPGRWAEPLGITVYEQLGDHPGEWDEDTQGFGQRLAANAGRTAISLTVRHGVAAVLGVPAGPVRCAAASSGARLTGAVLVGGR